MDVVLFSVSHHLPGKSKENLKKDWARMTGDAAEV
jgi:hypothetical protein